MSRHKKILNMYMSVVNLFLSSVEVVETVPKISQYQAHEPESM